VNARQSPTRLVDIVDAGMAFEVVADGLLFTEGPLWDATRNRLLFSDIPGNTIYQWDEHAGLAPFRNPSNMANGLTWDREGRLLACEHATSRVTRQEADGRLTVIAHALDGTALNSPNDIVVRSDGTIWFTDPTYGRSEYYGVPRVPELGFRGVYRVEPDSGRITAVANDFAQPNGLCFSADERRLYVNDTERMHIRAFEVHADGTLDQGRVWANVAGTGEGAPDGMKLDREGHLYCCGPGGVHVFDEGARPIGVIETPAPAANFTWGGADLRSLYVTASATVLRFSVRVPGRAHRS